MSGFGGRAGVYCRRTRNQEEWMRNGLFDMENRLEYLTGNGGILPNLKELMPWEDFRSKLEVIYDHERKSNTDPRLFDMVLMFKILILHSL